MLECTKASGMLSPHMHSILLSQVSSLVLRLPSSGGTASDTLRRPKSRSVLLVESSSKWIIQFSCRLVFYHCGADDDEATPNLYFWNESLTTSFYETKHLTLLETVTEFFPEFFIVL